MRLIDADELSYDITTEDEDYLTVTYEEIQDQPIIEAIPIGYIDRLIDYYNSLADKYLYDDDEEMKVNIYYRNCLNNLKRRWKRERVHL